MPSWLILQIFILTIALIFDAFVGEPPAQVHPVVWMGRIVAALETRLYKGTKRAQRLKGTAVATGVIVALSLIHISEPTRLLSISYAVFCLKKKNNKTIN